MEKKKQFIINTLYYSFIIIIIYLLYKYALGVMMPFIFGFLFAYISIRISKKLFKKDNKVIRTISLLLLYTVIVLVIILLGSVGVNGLADFFSSVPSLYVKFIKPIFDNIESNLKDANNALPYELRKILNNSFDGVTDSLMGLVSSISTWLVSLTTSLITYTPTLLLAIMSAIISSFFFLYDYETIKMYLYNLLPEDGKKLADEIKVFLTENVLIVLRTYMIIMFITFVELLIGFMLLKISNYGLIAFLTSIVDILPVLGVGTILIPWGIVDILLGNTLHGILIEVLYIIITIIRNIIEPKLVGGNLGLHPLLTLVAMIVGADFFGIIGLFGLPLLISFIITHNKAQNDGVK